MNLKEVNLTKNKMTYYNLPHDIFNRIQSFVVDDKVEHKNRLNVIHKQIFDNKCERLRRLCQLRGVFYRHWLQYRIDKKETGKLKTREDGQMNEFFDSSRHNWIKNESSLSKGSSKLLLYCCKKSNKMLEDSWKFRIDYHKEFHNMDCKCIDNYEGFLKSEFSIKNLKS
jgi:hypothetical protein